MNSFALWFNADEINKIDLEADVHFNLWNLHDKLSGPPCLDVGIKIKRMQICDAVNFYIPFTIDENNIRDLGSTLVQAKFFVAFLMRIIQLQGKVIINYRRL